MRQKTRNTKQKQAVWSVWQAAQGPLGPAEIYQQASQALPTLSLATVYRIVRTLCDEGIVVPVPIPGQPDRYETHKRAAHHHHHFLCDGCKRLFDVPGCGLRIELHNMPGFKVREHSVVLFGNCKECRKSPLNVL